MKINQKKSIVKIISLLFLILLMNGCEDIHWPHVFGEREVPEGALNEERLVDRPSEILLNDPSWPRLGDVPKKPKPFESRDAIQSTITQMQEDRTLDQSKEVHVFSSTPDQKP